MEKAFSEEAGFHAYDLRGLALLKLRNLSKGAPYLHYREARQHLCRLFHLSKLQARRLILELSREGHISFDVKGRIWLGEKGQKGRALLVEGRNKENYIKQRDNK